MINSKAEDPVKRAIVMVILNASIGIVLKTLNLYGSIFDLQHISFVKKTDIFYILVRFLSCPDNPTCYLVAYSASFLNLFPLCLFLIFFINFDKKFNIAFKSFFKWAPK